MDADTIIKLLNSSFARATISAFSSFDKTIETLKTISTYVSVILGVVFATLLYKLREINSPPETNMIEELGQELSPPKPASGGAMQARWDEIVRHMQSAKETEWKFAVIEADKLIDLVLARAGFVGSSLGERLMNMQQGELQNLEVLWEAHKIRNNIAHEVDYFLRFTEAKRAIEAYASVLREVGAIN
jgi:hypothetical protein